jgi:hypothetical protein
MIKRHKEVTKKYRYESSFSDYFCLMIEGSGSIPLTNGSGSGRPKNIWIRIRNTDYKHIAPRLEKLILPEAVFLVVPVDPDPIEYYQIINH